LVCFEEEIWGFEVKKRAQVKDEAINTRKGNIWKEKESKTRKKWKKTSKIEAIHLAIVIENASLPGRVSGKELKQKLDGGEENSWSGEVVTKLGAKLFWAYAREKQETPASKCARSNHRHQVH
jgi:hypothetical protein